MFRCLRGALLIYRIYVGDATPIFRLQNVGRLYFGTGEQFK